jgi:predicted ATP-dependent Lon-type protease
MLDQKDEEHFWQLREALDEWQEARREIIGMDPDNWTSEEQAALLERLVNAEVILMKL